MPRASSGVQTPSPNKQERRSALHSVLCRPPPQKRSILPAEFICDIPPRKGIRPSKMLFLPRSGGTEMVARPSSTLDSLQLAPPLCGCRKAGVRSSGAAQVDCWQPSVHTGCHLSGRSDRATRARLHIARTELPFHMARRPELMYGVRQKPTPHRHFPPPFGNRQVQTAAGRCWQRRPPASASRGG